MFVAIIGLAAIVLAFAAFILGAYMVKLWYMLPERKMSKPERKLNKLVEYFIYEDWYPHG